MYLSTMKELNTVNMQGISGMSNCIHWLDPLFYKCICGTLLDSPGEASFTKEL